MTGRSICAGARRRDPADQFAPPGLAKDKANEAHDIGTPRAGLGPGHDSRVRRPRAAGDGRQEPPARGRPSVDGVAAAKVRDQPCVVCQQTPTDPARLMDHDLSAGADDALAVLALCRGCHDRYAAYASTFPRTWSGVTARNCASRCSTSAWWAPIDAWLRVRRTDRGCAMSGLTLS